MKSCVGRTMGKRGGLVFLAVDFDYVFDSMGYGWFDGIANIRPNIHGVKGLLQHLRVNETDGERYLQTWKYGKDFWVAPALNIDMELSRYTKRFSWFD